MNVRQLYAWVVDQIADWGDTGVEWNSLVNFGRHVASIDPNRIECALGDLLNSRRIVRTKDNRLVVRD